MDRMRWQRMEAVKQIFSLAVKFFKQGDFEISRQAFEIVVREFKDDEKGFLPSIFQQFSLRTKAERYLKEIPFRQARAEAKQRKIILKLVQDEVRKQKKAEERQKKKEERIIKEAKDRKEEEKRRPQKPQEKVESRDKETQAKKYLRYEELQLIFQKALDCYSKNEIEVAAKLSEILLREIEGEKKRARFIEKLFVIDPLARKTKGILDKIEKKKREEEIRKRQVQKLKEIEEVIRKQKEEAKKPEEIEKQKDGERKDELIKKYEEGLIVRQREITEKYEKEMERQRQELLQKQNKLKMEEQDLKKLEEELEKQKAEIKEKYEQELEKTRKALKEQRIGELLVQKEEVKEEEKEEEVKKRKEHLRKKEEELKIREMEIRKMRETPAEFLPKEKEKKRQEDILMAEEEVKERRKIIENEIRKIEEGEAKKRGLSKEVVEKEETETEKEKKRFLLQEAIKKEKERRTPKEIEKEEKEKIKALKTLFDEAVFYYKENNLDIAVEIFQELKKVLREPEKEPGFFARISGKVPFYIKIEDYISKIEKEKMAKEERQIGIIREQAKIAAGKKRKLKYPSLLGLKRITNKLRLASPFIILRQFLFLPPLAAVDISDYSIEVLRLNKNRSILSYGRSIIKEGVIREGRIKDQKELSLSFKLAFNQAGFKPFRPKRGPIFRGLVSVSEYQANVQVFTFKSKDNIFDRVKEEIINTVPFPINELYWDYIEAWDEKLNETKVLTVAILKDIINEQIYFLKSSGVEPVVFDFEAASIGRALLSEKTESEKIDRLILDMGARLININIFDENGFINLSTVTPNAGDYLRDKTAAYFDISKEEAETIINLKGFRKENNVILEVLEKGMEKIIAETKTAIWHYQRRTGKEVKKIILTGGIALLPEIDKFFQSRFSDIEIEIGDPLKKIKRRGGLDPKKAGLYTNSIGLALRGLAKDPISEGINLLPAKIKEKEKKIYWQRHRQKLVIIKIILAALVVVAALLIYLYVI